MDSKVEAHLPRYDGPFFPDLTHELTALLATYGSSWTGEFLKKIGHRTFGYMRQDFGVKTSDNYVWFWGLEFRTGKNGRIVVLFPWSTMKLGDETSMPNRSVAVYTNGKVTEKAIERVLSILIEKATAKALKRAPT